jgi:hypothetical protein
MGLMVVFVLQNLIVKIVNKWAAHLVLERMEEI